MDRKTSGAVCLLVSVLWVCDWSPSQVRAPSANVSEAETETLNNKELEEWSHEEVSRWLVTEKLPHHFVKACLDRELAGAELVKLVQYSSEMTGQAHSELLAPLDEEARQDLEKSVQKITEWKGQPSLGFWGYLKIQRWHAEMVGTGLLTHPRLMLLYLHARERETTLSFLANRSAALPFAGWRPPVKGPVFWALWAVSPQVLIVSHAVPYFSASFWAMYVLTLMSMWQWIQEVTALRQLLLGSRHTAFNPSSVIKAYSWFVIYYWGILRFTPTPLCSIILLYRLARPLMNIAIKPTICVLRKQWHSAAFWVVLTAMPLVLGNANLGHAVTYLVLNLLMSLAFAGSRRYLQQISAHELHDNQFLSALAKLILEQHTLQVQEQDFLATSMSELNKIEAADLVGARPMSVAYLDEDHQKQQMGQDEGGLYRDWLSRAGEALLDAKHGAFNVEMVDGVELLRLRKDLDPEKAKFTGRLLALSLKAGVALGWNLSEPQAQLLLHPHVPRLVFANGRSNPFSAESKMGTTNLKQQWLDAALWASTGFRAGSWLCAAFGEGKAKWFRACLDESRTLAERQQDLEAGLQSLGEFEGTLVTLENLQPLMAQLEKSEFVHDSLRAVWAAFRSVPGVRIPSTTSGMMALELARARSSDCRQLKDAVFGVQHLDTAEWRRHTQVEPESAAGSAIVQWFWEAVGDLSESKRSQLFFWVSSLKRLPHGGWDANQMKMTLAITRDATRLPVAHTCSFQLDLPEYETQDELRWKLCEAMQHTTFSLA